MNCPKCNSTKKKITEYYIDVTVKQCGKCGFTWTHEPSKPLNWQPDDKDGV